MMAIRSPHVVRMMAVGKLPGGMPFLAMEYVQGASLQTMIYKAEQWRLPYELSLDMIDQIAIGLSAAHAAGVIHRDLKPGNVLVESASSCPVAKIFDFGLSLLAAELAVRLTLTGSTFGTPEYMAPEQIEDTSQVDPRADIYSLGVIAYQLFAGRIPFRGSTAREIWDQALHDAPVPLDTLRPELPPDLCDLVMRAMARDPDERPSSAEELRASLVSYRTNV
jgi:eukaryotic-like serine/threonine-protein kinase